MRIRLLTAIGGSEHHDFGAIVERPDAVARAWIEDGIAEPAEDDGVEFAVKAVPVETAVRGRRRR